MPKTILCVDDDSQIRELIQTYLEAQGYQVITSCDGWDCLREIIVKRPDLIIMDINMPKLDGLNTLDMIKVTRLTQHVPIILVSGEGDSETFLKASKLGADDFLVKPFSLTDLGNRITQQLFTVDFENLAEILKQAQPQAADSRNEAGVDPNKYQDWNVYSSHYNGVDLCVLLPKGLAVQTAATLSEDKAATQIVVLSKARKNWRCVWPHEENAEQAA
jgi:DNA-binding response OmpR family regulator